MTAVFGPEGGAAATEALAQLGEGAISWIDRRRTDRVAKTVEYAGDQIAQRRTDGEEVQRDFVEGEDAAAVFEAVITAAAESAEDRKCEILANVYASLAFDPDASTADALLLVRRVREASWRQLVTLQYLADDRRRGERESSGASHGEGEAHANALLVAEVVELAEALGLAGIGQDDGSVAIPSGTWGGGGFQASDLGKWTPTDLGARLLHHGRVAEVTTQADLDDLAAEFTQ